MYTMDVDTVIVHMCAHTTHVYVTAHTLVGAHDLLQVQEDSMSQQAVWLPQDSPAEPVG